MVSVNSCCAGLDLRKPWEFEVRALWHGLCLLLPGAKDTAELDQGHCFPVPGLNWESQESASLFVMLLFLTCFGMFLE